MNEIKGRTVNNDGSVTNEQSTLCEILYADRDIGGCYVNEEDEVKRFQFANTLCDTDIPAPVLIAELPYKNITWNDHWFTPEQYANINLQEWLLARCSTDEQKNRVLIELKEFEKRNMTAAIKHMIYCVDIWRENQIGRAHV